MSVYFFLLASYWLIFIISIVFFNCFMISRILFYFRDPTLAHLYMSVHFLLQQLSLHRFTLSIREFSFLLPCLFFFHSFLLFANSFASLFCVDNCWKLSSRTICYCLLRPFHFSLFLLLGKRKLVTIPTQARFFHG